MRDRTSATLLAHRAALVQEGVSGVRLHGQTFGQVDAET
jgi:hypothetical protein